MEPGVQVAKSLVKATGFGAVHRLEEIPGGHNNRVYQVQTDEGPVLLKCYFQHPDDPRDRLGTEFEFTRFLWSRGVNRVPKPFVADHSGGAALYEFIQGVSLPPNEVEDDHVDQALEFLERLQRLRDDPTAREFAPASEACFTLEDHRSTVASRLERLHTVEASDETDIAMQAFLKREVEEVWRVIDDRLTRGAKRIGWERERPLDPQNRVLSPSDFGFHNALLTFDGRVRFIDFEYAGWDDPSKLVSDFIMQLTHPLSPDTMESCLRSMIPSEDEVDRFTARTRLLLPLHRLKWCLIALNEFVKSSAARRQFANPDLSDRQRRERQLGKAKEAFRGTDWTDLMSDQPVAKGRT